LDSNRKHWVSVAAAIIDGERVLAIRRRDNHKWEPPGGTLERDETIAAGLEREILEETGLTIKDPVLSGIYKNMERGIVALVFRCQHDGSSPHPTEEASEARWMTPGEVDKLVDPAYACRLIDAFDTTTVSLRSHDGVHLLD
jgi:8-oxo-dGTP pyrophosphatase MutT (NUDIX family)